MATQTHVIASSSVQPISTPASAANGSSANGGGGSSNHIIGGKFRVGKKIGEGSFGVVFEGASCRGVCAAGILIYGRWG